MFAPPDYRRAMTREHDERSNQIRIARRRGEEERVDMLFVPE
jgi:hypothetical protein